MDFGRAKNVLIYAFFLLNLVLGYQLWSDMREQADANLDLTALGGNVQRVMEEKDIQVLSPIPSETPELYKIVYRYKQEEASGVTELEKPVDSKLVFMGSDLTAAIGDQIPELSEYLFDPLLSQVGTFIFHPLVAERWPLFNDQLLLYSSDQKIVSYEQAPIEIQLSNEEEPVKVLPAAKALGTLIENYFPEGSIVKDIQLGYYGPVFNSDSQVAAPAWRVMLESGKVYYVQGISGDVFSPET